MEKIIFNNDWKRYFNGHDLRSFHDFFDYSEGKTINQNTKRNVTVFELKDGEGSQTFFMKRFFDPHYKDMLFTFRNFGTLCSQAELEWRNARILLDHGIETYRPVCYGCRSICGIERQSFFVTKQIDGCCLLDYLLQSWEALDGDKREKLIVKLALFFRKIHTAGLSLPDSYIWHVYRIDTRNDPDGYTLGMIDLHRMQIRTRGRGPAAMNLGRFLFSLPEGFMDAELEELFLQSYLGGDDRTAAAFIRNVRKWEAKILKRRKKPVAALPESS
jgi:hypothetical protein